MYLEKKILIHYLQGIARRHLTPGLKPMCGSQLSKFSKFESDLGS